MSMRRRGMMRLARRNALRRFAVLGSMMLLGLAVQGVPPQIGIILLLFEPVGGVRALLVARGHVARNGFARGCRFRAFQGYDVAGHSVYSFVSAGVSSSSDSPASSSVSPKSEVTGCRVRVSFLCFSSWDWHSTVSRAKGIASSRACGIGLPESSQTP